MKRWIGCCSAFAILFLAGPSWVQADDSDYYGDNPPPVVYRRVPVYRPLPYYQAPAWASPGSAALGPWPWNFEFGGGPTAVGGTNNQLTGGSNFMIGGGYNFSPRVGFDLEFMNTWQGLTNQAIQANGAFDGDASIWSMTLNPIYRFRIGGPVGGYIIGGGGFYEREERFDEQVQVYDRFFGPGLADEEVRQTTDAGGVNAGIGLTCNLGWGTKLFVEGRFHYIFTPGTGTEIIPVTIGLRW